MKTLVALFVLTTVLYVVSAASTHHKEHAKKHHDTKDHEHVKKHQKRNWSGNGRCQICSGCYEGCVVCYDDYQYEPQADLKRRSLAKKSNHAKRADGDPTTTPTTTTWTYDGDYIPCCDCDCPAQTLITESTGFTVIPLGGSTDDGDDKKKKSHTEHHKKHGTHKKHHAVAKKHN